MDYPFFVPDWPIRKKVTEKYPDLKIIKEQPTSLWFGSGRKTMKNVDADKTMVLWRGYGLDIHISYAPNFVLQCCNL